jgi:hypothetical protein
MHVHRTARAILALGAAGPVIFIAAYTINGATQPDYDSWRDTISTLSLAHHGWIQVATFVVYGMLTLCFAEGLRRLGEVTKCGYALLVVAGLGLVIIGAFRTDPVLGFPVGDPSVVTPGGIVHSIGSLVVFLAFPGACCFATTLRPFRGWAAFSTASGILSLVAVIVFFAAVSAATGGNDADSPAGFIERLPTLIVGLWQVVFAVRVSTGRTGARATITLDGELPRAA